MSVRTLALHGLSRRAFVRGTFAAGHSTRCRRLVRIDRPILQNCSLSSSTIRRREDPPSSQATLGKVEPKLALTFTCAVTDCGHRSSHEFSRRSYEKGIVIVQCPSCKNRHLIADHLSWFTETEADPKNIEQIIASKGGKVQRGINYIDGQGYETMEIYKDDN